jgi:hypothetical protein
MRPGLRLVILVCLLLVFTPTPAALAANHWCDTDPLVVVQTPAGRLVPLYVNVGANSATYTSDTLLAMTSMSYYAFATKKADATVVYVFVTVPSYLSSSAFDTRLTVSSGPFGTLSIYSQVYGLSGQLMIASFTLPYP